MRKLSYWGKANPWSARLIIIVIHLILIIGAVLFGTILYEESIFIHPLMLVAAIVVYLLSVILYPKKGISRGHLSVLSYYVHQKSCDFLLVFTGIFMICFVSNRLVHVPTTNELKASCMYLTTTSGAASIHKAVESKAPVLKNLSRNERRQLIKEFKKEIRQVMHSRNNSGGKVALVILTILLAVALFSAVASLSCTLSCNGQEGASLVVLLLGTAAIVALCIVAIRAIYKKERINRKLQQQAAEKGA